MLQVVDRELATVCLPTTKVSSIAGALLTRAQLRRLRLLLENIPWYSSYLSDRVVISLVFKALGEAATCAVKILKSAEVCVTT